MTEKITRAVYRLPDARFIAGSLLGLLAILIGLYGLFLNQTVLNIVARKQMEQKIAQIDTAVSQHEFEYISKNANMTLEKALEFGYIEELDPRYVKADSGRRFTMNE